MIGESQRTDLAKELFKVQGNMPLRTPNSLHFEDFGPADRLFLNDDSVGQEF